MYKFITRMTESNYQTFEIVEIVPNFWTFSLLKDPLVLRNKDVDGWQFKCLL